MFTLVYQSEELTVVPAEVRDGVVYVDGMGVDGPVEPLLPSINEVIAWAIAEGVA